MERCTDSNYNKRKVKIYKYNMEPTIKKVIFEKSFYIGAFASVGFINKTNRVKSVGSFFVKCFTIWFSSSENHTKKVGCVTIQPGV